MNPVGVQLASEMRPPGRVTRTSSAAARAWSAANMTPIADSTWSNVPSAKGRSSAEASTKSIGRSSAPARRRATSSRPGT